MSKQSVLGTIQLAHTFSKNYEAFFYRKQTYLLPHSDAVYDPTDIPRTAVDIPRRLVLTSRRNLWHGFGVTVILCIRVLYILSSDLHESACPFRVDGNETVSIRNKKESKTSRGAGCIDIRSHILSRWLYTRCIDFRDNALQGVFMREKRNQPLTCKATWPFSTTVARFTPAKTVVRCTKISVCRETNVLRPFPSTSAPVEVETRKATKKAVWNNRFSERSSSGRADVKKIKQTLNNYDGKHGAINVRITAVRVPRSRNVKITDEFCRVR